MPDTLLRAFPAELELARQGRQLTGRLVPYNSPTDVLDIVDGEPDLYREGFRRGAFAPQAGSTEPGVFRRIGLIHKHEGGLGYLGSFSSLREEPDGLYGDVDLLRSRSGDVEDLLSVGVQELSVEFRVGRGGTEVVDGVRWRVKAHLDNVALEPKGAYSGARVLAMRDEVDQLEKEQAEQAAADAAKADADAAAAEEQARVEAEAAAAAERKVRWDALAARLDAEQAKQSEYVRSYVMPRERVVIT